MQTQTIRRKAGDIVIEPFIVKHYSEDERPTLKGNGFDGLEIGADREEAERFVEWVNKQLRKLVQAQDEYAVLQGMLREEIVKNNGLGKGSKLWTKDIPEGDRVLLGQMGIW